MKMVVVVVASDEGGMMVRTMDVVMTVGVVAKGRGRIRKNANEFSKRIRESN